MTRYIVTEKQIVSGVEWALKQHISDENIVKILLRTIIEEVETILEDDCDQWGEEK